jgi:ABC-2 type transport system permease protein
MIRGELLKVLTTRTLLGYLAAGVVLAALNVVVIAVASGELDSVGEKREALSGLPILLALFGLVGAAGEFRHRTAAPAALAARSERARLLVARTGVYAATGVALAAVMTAVSLALGLPLLADQPGPDLAAGDVTALTSANLAAGLLFVIMGVALGTLMRNQVAGVVVLLMLNFFLNPLVSMADEAAGNLTPFGAAQVLTGMTHDTTLSSGAAALVLAAWTAPLLAVAIASDRRRDLA